MNHRSIWIKVSSWWWWRITFLMSKTQNKLCSRSVNIPWLECEINWIGHNIHQDNDNNEYSVRKTLFSFIFLFYECHFQKFLQFFFRPSESFIQFIFHYLVYHIYIFRSSKYKFLYRKSSSNELNLNIATISYYK